MRTLSGNEYENLVKRVDGWKVWAIPALLDEEIFKSCCLAAEDVSGLFEPVHSSKSTAVYRFAWQGRDYYLKHYLFESWKKYLSLRLNVSRLIHIAQQLKALDFSTPEIVCIARKGRRMFTVSEAVDSDCSMNDLYMRNGAGHLEDRSRVREEFGHEIGRLHAAGFVHGDLRWGNVLVKNLGTEHPEFIYLDNDRTRQHRRIPARGRIKNLVQVHFVELLHNHPATHWEEFWRGYCSANPVVEARELYWRKRVERATARRVRRFFKKPDCRERLAGRTRKKTIAFCLFKYFPHGGLQHDFLRIAGECQHRGCAIRVYTVSWEGPVPEGFDVRIVPVRKASNHGRAKAFAEKVQTLLGSGPVDLVVGFNKMSGLDIYFASDSCFAERVAARSFFYRLTSRCRTYLKMEQAVFDPQARARILLIAPQQIDEFRRHYPSAETRFTLLPPGLDEHFQPLENLAEARRNIRSEFGVGEDDFLLLQVGSSFKTKGVDRGIQALAALPDDLRARCIYLVAGQGKAAAYRRLAKKLGVNERVRFAGVRQDISEVMAAADLLLHPARTEAAGKTLIESLASGLPVLCSGVCGYAPYVQEASAGLVLPEPFNQQALNSALLSMLDADQMAQYRKNIKTYCEQTSLSGLTGQAVECILKQIS